MKDRTWKGIRKYDFYRRLGYSAEAATVLSMTTYGTRTQEILIRELGRERHIRKVYEWMKTRPEKSLEEAAENLDREKHSPVRDQNGFAFRGRSSSAGGPVALAMAFSELDLDACDMLDVDMPCLSVTAKVHPSIAAGLPGTDSYEEIEEKPARSVFTSPSSTFRMTTSSASMGILLNQIRNREAIYMDQVRIEEILNAFDYKTEVPTDEKFKISTELLPKKDGKKLLYINVQACEEKKEHQNIVLLLDVSGSMCSNNEVTQETVAAILSKLRPGDRLSFVTYSDIDHTVLDGYEIRGEQDKEELMGILLGIEIEGCTYGSAGIETAYRLGAKHYCEGWSNQVILITDGDLNFGVTEKHGLRELIEEKKKSGLFLSVIGTGLGNYKDDKLETLSKHGNGTYCVVNELPDVEDCIERHYAALTNVIAKDVKAQVEFNPRFVKSHRLLGYENRELAHEDFKNDAVISEPYGSGGHGVALYELGMSDGTAGSELRYMTPVPGSSNELCTVSVRWKEPLSDVSSVIEKAVSTADTTTENAELAYLLYCMSEMLRGSDKLDDYDTRFLDVMLTSGRLLRDGSPNAEKLKLLKDALEHNDKRLGRHSGAGEPLMF